jgi:DNA-binding IclR family transcriptional regulator
MIRAVGRALAIFDAFDNDHLSLTLQEISERIRMPKTTAFRLVHTLEQAGFLVRMENQQYCLSLKLVRLAGMVRRSLNICEIARPIMADVNRQTSETITLNTISGFERLCLDVVDTPSPLMSMVRPGQHMPMLLGASSRILMAHMTNEELESLLKVTAAGVGFDRAALDRELARFRRQGYALSRGQRVPGLTAIAVPIFDIDGRAEHSLALTGPSFRVDPHDIDFAEIMRDAGRDISNRFGANPPTLQDVALREVAQFRAAAADVSRSRSETKRGPTAKRVKKQH